MDTNEQTDHDPKTGEVIEGRVTGGDTNKPAAVLDPNARPKGSASILWLLGNLDDGRFAPQADALLHKINKALLAREQTHGGKAKGKLTIDIEFVLDRGVVEIAAVSKVKLPEDKPMRTIMWPTPNGGFALENPRQLTMGFGPKEVYPARAAE